MTKKKLAVFGCILLLVICIVAIKDNSYVKWENYDVLANKIHADMSEKYKIGTLVDTYFMGCSSVEWAVTNHDILDDDPLKPMRQAFQVYHTSENFSCYVVLFYAPENKSNYYFGAFLPGSAIETNEIDVQTFSRLFATKGVIIEVLATSKDTDKDTYQNMVVFVDEVTNTIQKSIG